MALTVMHYSGNLTRRCIGSCANCKCVARLHVVHADSALKEHHGSRVGHTYHFEAVMCAVSSRSVYYVLNQSMGWMLTSAQ